MLLSFDDWLFAVINLMTFCTAQEAYDTCFDSTWTKEAQLLYADGMLKNKAVSNEQHSYLLHIIDCVTEIWQEKN